MTLTQLQLPDEITQRYDELARHTGHSRERVMREVLEAHLTQVAAKDASLAAAIAEADRGEVIDMEEIHAEDQVFHAQLGLAPEQLAAIEAEVEREADAFYGSLPLPHTRSSTELSRIG